VSAARKRSPVTARARLSAILDEIEKLVGEFEDVRSAARLEVGGDVPDTITQALGDAREMVGDIFDIDPSDPTVARWTVAAREPMTRKQLDAELEERGVRRTT